jgi:hypothetical protein
VSVEELEAWTEQQFADRALPDELQLGTEFTIRCPFTVYALNSTVPPQDGFLTVDGSPFSDHPFASQQTDTPHVITVQSGSESPQTGESASAHTLHNGHDAVLAVNPGPIPDFVHIQVAGVMPDIPPEYPPAPVHTEQVAGYDHPSDQAVPDRTTFEHSVFWRPHVQTDDGSYELLDESIFFDISTVSIAVYPVTVADPFLTDADPAFIASLTVDQLTELFTNGRPAQRADTVTDTGYVPLTTLDSPDHSDA